MRNSLKLVGNLDILKSSHGIALTVGVFDGVHIGHHHLLKSILARAHEIGASSAVVTFDPHPQRVIAPGSEPLLLTTVDERVQLIRSVGIDVVGILRFTRKISRMSAEEFIDMLLKHFALAELWMGPDSAFGYRRQGTPQVLSEIGGRKGFVVRVVSQKRDDGNVISSTQIRTVLLLGDVSEAATLLGRPYALVGVVVTGFERGRDLGFPTANVVPPPGLLVPANGIYAVRVRVGQRDYDGVLNIGVRPTFDDGVGRSIEVHIIDFVGNLYGQQIRLEFIQRLRDETRFASVQQLVEQIKKDVELARVVLQR